MDFSALTFTNSMIEFIQKTGIFFYPLFACSLAGLTAIIYKWLSLSNARILPAPLVRKIESLKTPDFRSISQELNQGQSTFARLAHLAINHSNREAEEITRIVESSAREEVLKMHSGISVLNMVITIAPLLGLLGTASGLVTIFQGLGETTNHISIAQGIAEALNTTILGLAIAVPCVIAHTYFTRRIEVLSARMENLLNLFLPSTSSSPKP